MKTKIQMWHIFLMAIGLNGLFGYIVGGFSESGKYVGQTFFYGGILLFFYYTINYAYSNYKNSKNLILKE